VRAEYLDQVVWDHITALLADPALIRTEIDRRLEAARTADPVTKQRRHLQIVLAGADAAISRLIEALAEGLITIDELRARMPQLRARQAMLRGQLDALDTQLADRQVYLRLAEGLEGFLAQLRERADTASVPDRQRVLRLLVKDVLVGPEKITIHHRIPVREPGPSRRHHDHDCDTEGDHGPSYPLCWGREQSRHVQRLPAPTRSGVGRR
jgi:site-specific DNA recombinase